MYIQQRTVFLLADVVEVTGAPPVRQRDVLHTQSYVVIQFLEVPTHRVFHQLAVFVQIAPLPRHIGLCQLLQITHAYKHIKQIEINETDNHTQL